MTYAEVKAQYQQLREQAYQDTEKRFNALSVSLRNISEEDAIEADAWEDKHGVRSWSWRDAYFVLRKDPKRFDLAILKNKALCALCLGHPTGGKLALKLIFVESRSIENPLKGAVLNIVFFAAHAYAKAIGSLEVHICDPANDHLVALYEKYGYASVPNKSGKITLMKKATT